MDNVNHLTVEENTEIESLYTQYRQNPNSVEDNWRLFFEGVEFARLKPSESDSSAPGLSIGIGKEFKVVNLINGYRTRGHLFTKTNPVRERRKYSPTLNLENFGLGEQDLETNFHAGTLIGIGEATLRDIIAHLKATYCRSVGAEYKYIRSPEVTEWLEKRMESSQNSKQFSIEEKKRILKKLNEAIAFESFIHTKFIGQKRFSVEGNEGLIPALDVLLETGSALGLQEFIIGMAHRGRLNVLANTLKKSYEEIFEEFEGLEFSESTFAGDVKYHMGYSSDLTTLGGNKIHVKLAPNPSHLEAVDSIVQGVTRAKMDNVYGGDENKIIPILIHGDAAIAAQGVVYEVVQMSKLRGYKTGGTIHIILNNQIGFTTNYLDGRSSTYCTDVAKVTLSPVFHVNADDVEALAYTIELALAYRKHFHQDIFIDMLGYRKYGHNESDEPRFTQPLLYKAIATHPNLREIYNQKLLTQGEIETNLVKEMEVEFKQLLQKDLDNAKQSETVPVPSSNEGRWKKIRPSRDEDFDLSPVTGVKKEDLIMIGEKISTLPTNKKFFDKIVHLFNERKAMMDKGDKINWAMGELLAYGTLLTEGFGVRFGGQDVERGTFSHRHAVVRVQDSEENYIPLNNINNTQARFCIFNSLLSEYAALGFEYGYALSAPDSLVIWEAQFGDFVNGAQVIIDQYLSCAENKWKQMNGITLLLPHGYEGQGAEHSSARLERFLQLSAENNMQVVNCTTPANFFHVLRRQLKRDIRKPLIVLTPKSLLRHPRCVSHLSDLAQGEFREIIEDPVENIKNIKRLIFCSGKIYYDLIIEREKRSANKDNPVLTGKYKIDELAIVRVEQLYPFPKKQFDQLVKKYQNVKEYYWVQEEPENMGAWNFLLRTLKSSPLQLISRPASASPATGSARTHEKEQKSLIQAVFS